MDFRPCSTKREILGQSAAFPRILGSENPSEFRAGKNNKLNFLWPKMARLGPPFDAKNPPEKVYVGPIFFCVLSQEMRHINFFLGAQIGVFWVGAKKFMLKKFMCFFGPLRIAQKNNSQGSLFVRSSCQRAMANQKEQGRKAIIWRGRTLSRAFVNNPTTPWSQQFTYGVVSEGVFAESLQKFCGKFADSCKNVHFIASGNSAESLQKIRGNLRKIFCNAEISRTFAENFLQ